VIKVLVVDDSGPFRRLLVSVLADLAQVYECADGSAALQTYLRCRPDWILMDIRMQQCDGLQATAQIVATDPAAKVVIVTDYGGDDLRDAARRVGACGFVQKDNLFELRRVLTASPITPGD
jgi:CheY-like chemotaxis protein